MAVYYGDAVVCCSVGDSRCAVQQLVWYGDGALRLYVSGRCISSASDREVSGHIPELQTDGAPEDFRNDLE